MPRKKMQTEEDAAAARMGDFGSAITQICDEKGISKDKVIETVEAALAAAYKKDYGKRGQNISAFIISKTDPGVSFSAGEKKLGIKGSPTREV